MRIQAQERNNMEQSHLLNAEGFKVKTSPWSEVETLTNRTVRLCLAATELVHELVWSDMSLCGGSQLLYRLCAWIEI